MANFVRTLGRTMPTSERSAILLNHLFVQLMMYTKDTLLLYGVLMVIPNRCGLREFCPIQTQTRSNQIGSLFNFFGLLWEIEMYKRPTLDGIRSRIALEGWQNSTSSVGEYNCVNDIVEVKDHEAHNRAHLKNSSGSNWSHWRFHSYVSKCLKVYYLLKSYVSIVTSI